MCLGLVNVRVYQVPQVKHCPKINLLTLKIILNSWL